MPIYTLKCERCQHVSERGFTVPAFVAQKEQKFAFLFCGRCERRGTMGHDFIADAKTQAAHLGTYTFGENAPEDRLVGQTVSKQEAKAILKKHGLVDAGKSAKKVSRTNRRTITEKDILDRWGGLASAKNGKSPAKDTGGGSVSVDKVDKTEPTQDTIVAKSWPALKAQAKKLGITAPVGTKRPELERLVRDRIAG